MVSYVIKGEFGKWVAPINYLSDLKGAVLLNHVVDDRVLYVGYSRDLNT